MPKTIALPNEPLQPLTKESFIPQGDLNKLRATWRLYSLKGKLPHE